MSEITKPILLNETYAEKMDAQNLLLAGILGAQGGTVRPTTMQQAAALVRAGLAERVFHPGDQLISTWKDTATETEYTAPWNVLGFRDVTLEDGSVVPGMYIQLAYATPFGVQFSNAQAFYYAKEELAAGTYHFTLKSNWGKNAVGGKVYQFTLTKPVPAGGQLRGMVQMPDQVPADWRISSYANNTATTAIETVTPTEGSGGTDMGTMPYGTTFSAGTYPLNNMQRTAYGDNQWKGSAMEQWLNSDADVGNWWKPKDNYDVPPTQLAQKAGFLSGLSEDFLSAIRPVKVTTFRNTTALDGSADITYDKVFLLSLEETYINPQIKGEGEAFDYWKLAAGTTSPALWRNATPNMVTYALENHTSPQSFRLRSADRGSALNAWHVNASGYVNGYGAWSSDRVAPACVIC